MEHQNSGMLWLDSKHFGQQFNHHFQVRYDLIQSILGNSSTTIFQPITKIRGRKNYSSRQQAKIVDRDFRWLIEWIKSSPSVPAIFTMWCADNNGNEDVVEVLQNVCPVCIDKQ